MGAEYRTGNNLGVGASEPRDGFGGKLEALNGKPHAEVTFPNAELDPVTVFRPFPTYEDAKAAAKAIAGQINALAPRGFPVFAKSYSPAERAAREKIEAMVREWGGPEAVVIEV